MTIFTSSPDFPLFTVWFGDVRNAGDRLHLTPRQPEVWNLLARGHRNAALAAEPGRAPKWIDHAVGALCATLDIDTLDRRMNARVRAALLWLPWGAARFGLPGEANFTAPPGSAGPHGRLQNTFTPTRWWLAACP